MKKGSVKGRVRNAADNIARFVINNANRALAPVKRIIRFGADFAVNGKVKVVALAVALKVINAEHKAVAGKPVIVYGLNAR